MSIQAANLQFCDGDDVYQPNAEPDIGMGSNHDITDRWAPTSLEQPQEERWDLNGVPEPNGSLDLVDKYQVLPDLTGDEYQALKNDIEKHGVQQPINVDEHGHVIDGHHRVQACRELGYRPTEIPKQVHRGLSEKEKRRLSYRLNLQRRHLESGQKRKIAKQYLRSDWDGEASEREVADDIGVSKTTVHRAIKDLKESGESVHLDQFTTGEQRTQIQNYLETHPKASNREIARNIAADISHQTVGKRRAEIESADREESHQQTIETVLSEAPTVTESQSSSTDSATSRSSPTPTKGPQPESDEKATPRNFFEPIEEAIGGFDLDPCSGAEDEALAETTYTREDDGLSQDWQGTVYVNPPYSDMMPWIEKIIAEISTDRVETILLLSKADSSTTWWQTAARAATVITAVDHRLQFQGSEEGAPFANHLMVFGDVPPELVDALADQGLPLRQIQDYETFTT